MSGEALTYVEIDIDYCALTYSVPPCMASLTNSPPTGTAKCFNSRSMCQDIANYDEETKTLRFAMPTAALPRNIDIIGPWVSSVEYSPAIVSLGESLGQRASIKIIFTEHRHSDAGDGLDKYQDERGYDPYTRGTFWSRFRKRHPFIRGRALRLINGFVGDALADMETRHFFIESFDGPTPDGKFSITAKDALKFLDGDRAQAPVLSTGALSVDIDDAETDVTLSPAGIGDDEYPLEGYAVIGGSEVVSFSRYEDVGDNDIHTKVLLHLDGANGGTTFTDVNAGGSAKTWTPTNATTSTVDKKFGTASMLGAAGKISTPDHDDFTLGAADFTIDFWFNRNGNTGIRGLFGQGNVGLSSVSIGASFTAGNTIAIYAYSGLLFQTTGTVTGSAWHHFALVRNGSSFKVYIDGVADATSATNAAALPNLSSNWYVGSAGDFSGAAWSGYIDEFRLSAGIARWTANFTPSAAAYAGSTVPVSTGDDITIVRGQWGTAAKAHSAQDRVQVCVAFLAQDPADIIADLIEDYTDTPAGYVQRDVWREETQTNLGRVYTALIAEPTAVNKLVSEIVEQAALAIWDDNVEQTIRLQVLRGIITDADRYAEYNVIARTFSLADQFDKRLSQVWVYFGQIDPTKPVDDVDNYRTSASIIDAEAETNHGTSAIKKIFSRWIPAPGKAIAERLGAIVLGRYVQAPRKMSFDVMRGNVDAPQLGGGYRFEWWNLQDESGLQEDIPIQVTRLIPSPAAFRVEADEMLFSAPAEDLANRQLVIDFNINDFNWKSAHDQLYQEIESGQTCTCTIMAGAIVGSTSVAIPAFDVGTWPAGVTLVLILMGRIQGKGGNGGGSAGANGQAGGIALYTREAISLDVDEGEIWSGGGGGGGVVGGGGTVGGGGGAGQLPGNGGPGASPGDAGTTEAGGAGGPTAAAGGGPGLAGSNAFGGGTGGAAGAAIDGVSFITVTEGPGDIQGSQIN